MTLREAGRQPETGLSGDELRGVRLWCRRRADQKVQRALAMVPYWLHRMPHEEARYLLGLTVEEYRRARRWLDRAADRCTEGRDHLHVSETLVAIADEHVDAVLRFGLLKGRGQSHEQIRERLELSERDLDVVSEWWRDAVAAVRDYRGRE